MRREAKSKASRAWKTNSSNDNPLVVFVSFPFFLQQVPFSTTRCQKQTVNPWFNETFSVKQVVTEDFIDYLSHSALEIELWGAPDSKIDPEDEAMVKQVVQVGELIEFDLREALEHQDEEDDEEVDIAFLNEQLDDTKHELKVQRDVVKQAKAEREKADKEKLQVEEQKEKLKKELEEKIRALEDKAKKDADAIAKLKASNICSVM